MNSFKIKSLEYRNVIISNMIVIQMLRYKLTSVFISENINIFSNFISLQDDNCNLDSNERHENTKLL